MSAVPVTSRIGVRIAIGAICGLAWSASLRSYMAEISGSATGVNWVGTFIGILLPGVVAGAALGAATIIDAHERRGRIALGWCAAAVLAFAVFPMLLPGQLWLFVTTGLGGGAVGVALGGLAGGYAAGGRPTWGRIVCGLLAIVLIAGVVASVPLVGGARLAVTTPRGAWVMLLAGSLMIVLMIGAAIPFRRLDAARGDADAGSRGSARADQPSAASHSANV
ncbi:hypothetical protein [Microbacterium ulmi]|uniref:Uncharacterized protein n=1 Tax=Microbacterium ulmi TaxID=179095 RepID=A0A7Y2M2D8_9MICO|nr:hypothetical protein [Microbacterium ulmi]NII68854.1 hypothetical protein [Microbacterium ulmi]NNH05266.1 hypothetical protein [Microbacterium ulmi]